MTLEPTEIRKDDSIEDIPGSFPVLEDIFALGYTESKPTTLFKDENTGFELVIHFRTLTPSEHRDIFTAMGKYDTFASQDVTKKLETLARAVKLINSMPLILPNNEITEFYNSHNRNPTPLEQAKIIFTKKIKSMHVIDAIWDAYQEFIDNVSKEFEDIKKKLNDQKSSELT